MKFNNLYFEQCQNWQSTWSGGRVRSDLNSGDVHYFPRIILRQVKINISDYKMGNVCDARYWCEPEAADALGAAEPPGKDLLGARAWHKGALCVISLNSGF